jgi:hypothetical protein
VATPRNKPFEDFLRDGGFRFGADGSVFFDSEAFAKKHLSTLEILTVRSDGEPQLAAV